MDPTKPETWKNLDAELETVFSEGERGFMITQMYECMMIDPERSKEALKVFLASQAAKA